MTTATTETPDRLANRWGWTEPSDLILALAGLSISAASAPPEDTLVELGILDKATMLRLQARCPKATSFLEFAGREEPSRVQPHIEHINALRNGYPYYRTLAPLQVHAAMTDAAVLRRCEQLDCVLMLIEDTQPALVFANFNTLLAYRMAGRSERAVDAILGATAGESPLLAVGARDDISALLAQSGASGSDRQADDGSAVWTTASAETRENPAARELARLIDHAIQAGATDIAITPNRDGSCQIRMRKWGSLIAPKTASLWSPEMAADAIRVLETKSGANPSMTTYRIPRDGQISYRSAVGEAFLRLSFMPLNHLGELRSLRSVSVRVFSRTEATIDLDGLGLQAPVIQALDDAVRMPQGLILVAGPMNSGKSTTIAGTIGRDVAIYGDKKKRISVEDPIERFVAGVTQVNVPAMVQGRNGEQLDDHQRFTAILRGLKRHDANTIWVGEVRDKESAGFCTTFASSGHLVMSTIHAKDATLAYDILSKMVPADVRFQLIESMALAVSQRLIPTLCPHCSVERAITPEDQRLWTQYMHMLGEQHELPETLAQASPNAETGCTHCDDGYQGYAPINEVLPFTRAVRDGAADLIAGRNTRAAIAAGRTLTLVESGLVLLREGRVELSSILFL